MVTADPRARLAAAFPPGLAEAYADDIDRLAGHIADGCCTVDQACEAITRAVELADAVQRGEFCEAHGEQIMVQLALAQRGDEEGPQ